MRNLAPQHSFRRLANHAFVVRDPSTRDEQRKVQDDSPTRPAAINRVLISGCTSSTSVPERAEAHAEQLGSFHLDAARANERLRDVFLLETFDVFLEVET